MTIMIMMPTKDLEKGRAWNENHEAVRVDRPQTGIKLAFISG